MSGRSALVIGNGGREHAIVKSLGPDVTVFITPGNAGTAIMSNVTNVVTDDPVVFAQENNIDFAIIGPDSFIAAGLADEFRVAGIPVFGASQAAGRLESSKSFASDFMTRHDIPQPKSTTVHNASELASDTDPLSIVLKADGLALGKGVVLPETAEEAKTTLREMLEGIGYEGAGKEGVVIQERLSGPEVSAFAVTDGTNYLMLPFSQDHKRLKTGDIGPNTGGMGAYAPLPESIVNADQAAKIHDIARKTIDGMKADGTPYQSVLYIGLMLAEQRGGDPVVIEYNARFGDPETQVMLTLLEDAGVDVYELLKSTDSTLNNGLIDGVTFNKTAITVCEAASGYPESPRKGDEILGLDGKLPAGVFVHNAGTKMDGDKVVTNGGRVLYVTAVANNIDEAAANAYSVINENGVHFDGMQYRTDIGKQAEENVVSDRPKIAILASANGTTAEALIYATQNGVLNADVVLVVSNNENAGVLQKIERFNQQGMGIKMLVINGKTHPGEAERGAQTIEESQAIYDAIKDAQTDLVLLLGYMKKVVAPLLDLPMLNTHPGLLPATRAFHGQDVQKFVLEQNHEFSGQTLHKVTAEYDAGETIIEHKIPVMPWDTVETLNAAVQAIEKANIGVDVERFLKF